MTRSMKKELRKCLGKFLTSMNTVMKRLRENNPGNYKPFMTNKNRNGKFSEPFAASCGSPRDAFNFETGSVSIACSWIPLKRHRDTRNDSSENDDLTCTFSFLIPSGDADRKSPRRLSIIGYTRNVCKLHCQKQESYASEITNLVRDYLDKITPYEMFRIDGCGLKKVKSEILNLPMVTSPGERAFPSKLGYYSSFSDRICRLDEVYDLDDNEVLELVYLACLSNGQERFYEVATQMLVGKDMKGE